MQKDMEFSMSSLKKEIEELKQWKGQMKSIFDHLDQSFGHHASTRPSSANQTASFRISE